MTEGPCLRPNTREIWPVSMQRKTVVCTAMVITQEKSTLIRKLAHPGYQGWQGALLADSKLTLRHFYNGFLTSQYKGGSTGAMPKASSLGSDFMRGVHGLSP